MGKKCTKIQAILIAWVVVGLGKAGKQKRREEVYKRKKKSSLHPKTPTCML